MRKEWVALGKDCRRGKKVTGDVRTNNGDYGRRAAKEEATDTGSGEGIATMGEAN